MFRRFFFIILMLILPLQASWAAAGAYCQHEQDSAAQHFGHHAHKHSAADKDKKSGAPSASFHADCASCHLGCAGIVTASPDVPSSAPTFLASSPEINFLPSVVLQGPERPKWAAAV